MLRSIGCWLVLWALAADAAAQNRASNEYLDTADSGRRENLSYARWVTERADGERRVDAFVFDCPRRLYAHIVHQRYRGEHRVESIVVPEPAWKAQLAALPGTAAPQLVHRVHDAVCPGRAPASQAMPGIARRSFSASQPRAMR